MKFIAVQLAISAQNTFQIQGVEDGSVYELQHIGADYLPPIPEKGERQGSTYRFLLDVPGRRVASAPADKYALFASRVARFIKGIEE